jgi:hypothetical protein
MTRQEKTMEAHLDDFVRGNPAGWGHDQWQSLLARLEADGHDVSDPAGIGQQLERRRLRIRLEEMRVPGMGPKRTEAVADHFVRLWDVEQASVDELAAAPKITRRVAEKLHKALR